MMKQLLRFCFSAVAFVFLAQAKTNAQISLPPDFADEVILTNATEVTGVAIDSAGRIFISQHEGTVWRVNNGVKVSPAIIDISQECGRWNAHGLMSITLDKNFTTNGYIYLYYTVDRHHLMYFGTPNYNPNTSEKNKATIDRVTRFQLDPSTNFTTLVPNSRFVILGKDKKNGISITYNNHDGGGMQMANDGTLIIAAGDGGHGGAADMGSNTQTYYLQALADTIITDATNVGAFRAQSLQSYNGKVLRIDPMTGYGVPSNPYYNATYPDAVESKIWALGMRQPFSMTIRPGSGSTNAANGNPGAIFVNDVGFYNWEEENVVTAPGQNFGWPVYEGFLKHPNFSSANVYNLNAANPLNGTGGCTTPHFRFADLIKDDTQGAGSWPNPCNTSVQIPTSIPLFKHRRAAFAYKHGTPVVYVPEYTGNNPLAANIGTAQTTVTGSAFDGSCIMGSAWIPNTAWPAKYHDAMFFMDYDLGWIRYAKFDANHKLISIDTFATNVGRPTSMHWHPIQKCIYWVDYISGQLHRIKYTVGANLAPVAVASQNKLFGVSPLSVQFNGASSYDPESAPLTYAWSFGNGVTSTLQNPTVIYTAPNSNPIKYNVTLTVTDTAGKTDTKTLFVSVNNTPPNVEITSPINGSYYSSQVAQIINLNSNVNDAEHNASQLHYKWYSTLHHNEHDHPNPIDTDAVTYLLAEPEDCENNYWLEVILTVTDDAGLSGVDTVIVYQSCIPEPLFEVADDTICLKTSVQYFDKSQRFPNQWHWSFPGGTPATSTLQNPIVTYDATGNYGATLIATSPEGSDTLTLNNVVKVVTRPNPKITAHGATSFCDGNVNLSTEYNSTYTYQWRKNGNNVNGATDTIYNATSAGSYTVIATNKFGCSHESPITTITTPLIAKAKAEGTSVLCPGDSIKLNATPTGIGYSYEWYRNNILLPAITTPSFYAKVSGVYKVRITQSPTCINLSKAKILTDGCREGDIDLNSLMSIYPNPSNTEFNIEAAGEVASDYVITITDLTGRIVVDETVVNVNSTFTIGKNLPEGIYMLTVVVNQKTETYRLIKTK